MQFYCSEGILARIIKGVISADGIALWFDIEGVKVPKDETLNILWKSWI